MDTYALGVLGLWDEDEIDLGELVKGGEVAHDESETGIDDIEVPAEEESLFEVDGIGAVRVVGVLQFAAVALEGEGVGGCVRRELL
jgi:hypothetical protein